MIELRRYSIYNTATNLQENIIWMVYQVMMLQMLWKLRNGILIQSTNLQVLVVWDFEKAVCNLPCFFKFSENVNSRLMIYRFVWRWRSWVKFGLLLYAINWIIWIIFEIFFEIVFKLLPRHLACDINTKQRVWVS